jgi:hypothetical protein
MKTVGIVPENYKGGSSKILPRRAAAKPTSTTSMKHKVGKKKVTKIKIKGLGPKLGVKPAKEKVAPRKTGPRKRM